VRLATLPGVEVLVICLLYLSMREAKKALGPIARDGKDVFPAAGGDVDKAGAYLHER
jgi:hypothetical protein